jgi:hypothetical protein
MHFFADARYMLWINGNYVARGPNRFDHKRPEYDTLQVGDYLHAGANTLAVLVQSRLSKYRFIKHTPGLGLLLEAKDGDAVRRFVTDTTWRSSASTRFSPPVVLLSGIAGDTALIPVMLKSAVTQQDSNIDWDDCIRFSILEPGAEEPGEFKVYVNSKGVTHEFITGGGKGSTLAGINLGWNPRVKSASTLTLEG